MGRTIAAMLMAMTAMVLSAANASAGGALGVEGESFVLTTGDGKRLTTSDLVGATLEMADQTGATFNLHIAAAKPAPDRPSLMLLSLMVKDTQTGKEAPFCEKDASGRVAGFPVAGAWDANGRFIADKNRWFITCTSGSQGKCILFGYDPWSKGPHGENLVPYYEACQHMVRADYDGVGTAHTKNGTVINIWDHIGIQVEDIEMPGPFEAGWKPDGAACVAKTRWPDLLTLEQLRKATPRFVEPCDEDVATKKGAILFNRSN